MKKLLIGIDEAGRGPLAGPVFAAAVALLDPQRIGRNPWASRIRDSKTIGEREREELYEILVQEPSLVWGFSWVSPRVIDRINIAQATRRAMERSWAGVVSQLAPSQNSSFVIVDGIMRIRIPMEQQAIPRADATVFECSAASVIAKVARDRVMRRLDKHYPQYGFAQHKGYGTRYHMEMLKKHGPSPSHRLSFAPISALAHRSLF